MIKSLIPLFPPIFCTLKCWRILFACCRLFVEDDGTVRHTLDDPFCCARRGPGTTPGRFDGRSCIQRQRSLGGERGAGWGRQRKRGQPVRLWPGSAHVRQGLRRRNAARDLCCHVLSLYLFVVLSVASQIRWLLTSLRDWQIARLPCGLFSKFVNVQA